MILILTYFDKIKFSNNWTMQLHLNKPNCNPDGFQSKIQISHETLLIHKTLIESAGKFVKN